jgi:hypothetical protein
MEDLKESMRKFANSSIRFNDLMTEADKAFLGIIGRVPHPTPVPNPVSRALLKDLKALGGYAVGLRYHDEFVDNSEAVPDGCNGCFVNFAVSPGRIDIESELTQTQLLTTSPARIQLPPEAGGQWLSIAPRWQLKKRGILGPWGPIEHVRVV